MCCGTCPLLAQRFWQLAKLRYMEGARFYRVVVEDFKGTGKPPFVVQVGVVGRGGRGRGRS